jgi:hypothetical protein
MCNFKVGDKVKLKKDYRSDYLGNNNEVGVIASIDFDNDKTEILFPISKKRTEVYYIEPNNMALWFEKVKPQLKLYYIVSHIKYPYVEATVCAYSKKEARKVIAKYLSSKSAYADIIKIVTSVKKSSCMLMGKANKKFADCPKVLYWY